MTTAGLVFLLIFIGAAAGFMALLTWAEIRTRP